MTDQLKSRYQKLVSLFPPGHRAVYADDMVTTLMAETSPGRRWPPAGTALNLLLGAGQAWAARARAKTSIWQQITVLPAIALLALFLLSSNSLAAAGYALDRAAHTTDGAAVTVVVLLPTLIWLPLTVAALLGGGRAGVWIAVLVGLFWPVANSLAGVGYRAWSFLDSPDQMPWLPVILLAVAGLGLGGGLRRGLRTLGPAAAGAGALGALLLGTVRTGLVAGPDTTGTALTVHVLLLGVGTALFTLACLTIAARTGRRSAVIAAIGVAAVALLSIVQVRAQGPGVVGQHLATGLALPLVLLVCALVAARSGVMSAAPDGDDSAPAAAVPLA